MNRRDFIRRTAGAMATAVSLQGIAETGGATLKATTLRNLGKTNIQCTLLGMGTGVKAWNGSSELNRKGREATESLLAHAYASGLRYFDLADMYGIHSHMKAVLKQSVSREKVVLLTKTVSHEGGPVRADLERFRKELDTDYLDIVLLHALTEGDWPQKLRSAMDALEEAKAKGWVRAHGMSCHSLEALKRATITDWVDVILARINPSGVKMDASPAEVIPVLQQAHAAGKGILGMKIVGEGELRDKLAESLGFVVRLGCVDAMPIGFLAPEEVDNAIATLDGLKIAPSAAPPSPIGEG